MAVSKKIGQAVIVLLAVAFVGLAGLHVYIDHQVLHILVSIEQVRQNQLRQNSEGK